MLTLSLLLGAAAGVNAILGGEVIGVKVAEGEYICADDCAYNGVFFGQTGFYCRLEEAVGRVTPDGTDDTWFPYQCAGAELANGYTERPRREGEEPRQCDPANGESDCLSNKSLGGPKNPKTIEWSEIAEQLKKAKSQDEQGSPEKTCPEKPINGTA
ncbi:hypothetical protein BBO_07641 [Beauveria brongniartii RCEF 3172]|uniref:Uncharacterized protein n=1 Tax=Beauveria brongniartii RCEF 3172 TaxID=1081107 RepID=A0A166Z6R7_9HYPO|nr:hypothetical protein BBO_07641 [Beauveria brongniartii RCEF 3172]